jgi:hypothetical protein
MAKKRPNRSDDADEEIREPKDPLGKLIQKHEVSLLGVLLLAGVVFLIGLGILAFALLRDPISLIALLIGTGVLLFSVVILGLNVFNVGRRLELRKRGVRFVQFGVATELFWDEIVDVEIDRTDSTYVGVATVRRRSADASSPSGLLTNSEFEVTIRGRNGATIRLPKNFLRTVGDPKKLISQLRLRAGLP